MDFYNSLQFERLVCFCVIIIGNLDFFQFYNYETDFLENENLFEKTGVTVFS